MSDRHVFDLDNTLIYTDLLNNNSYNYALERLGLPPISGHKRVTRDVVMGSYPHLNIEQKSEIIRLKQTYFINNIKKTKPNSYLLELLRTQNIEDCILWTSADTIRVQVLLKHYIINNAFRNILYSNKVDISQDIKKLCELFKCKLKQMIFYEDSQDIIKKLRELKLNVVVSSELS